MTQRNRRGRPKHNDILTPAEWRTVEGLRHGMTNRQIADRGGISVDAVKYHVANILQKLCLNSRAELLQWDGIAAHSNLSNAALSKKAPAMTQKITTPPSTHTLIEGVSQIARHTNNIEQARTWYSDVLGLDHLFSFGDLAFFNCGGVRLMLSQAKADLPDDAIIYFQVNNIVTAKHEMEARGITFTNAPHMVHKHDNGIEEWMAFFNDCDGRPLAITALHADDTEDSEEPETLTEDRY